MAKKKKIYDRQKEVKRLARERIGPVRPSVVLEIKTERKKPKHKKPSGLQEDEE
ncbi:MAG: hypothetical protein HUU41_01215 [Bryobacteraceae bacterium]|nr:hypothetical protein [Bryobacterales bacterium]MEB2360180.1 hypothetical protein [Bryobacterales bacterium]NUM99708.1 hypothetical protein [Bryobacteraceae bacterium]